MQNKPKLKSAQIPLIPFTQRTNKNALRPPQPKNKPKQSQIKDTATPASSRQLKSCFVSIGDNSRHKKMTNKPNFRSCKITLSDFHNKTNDYSPATDDHKNKPKQTQSEPIHPLCHSRLDQESSIIKASAVGRIHIFDIYILILLCRKHLQVNKTTMRL